MGIGKSKDFITKNKFVKIRVNLWLFQTAKILQLSKILGKQCERMKHNETSQPL